MIQIAWIALCVWPVVAIVLFRNCSLPLALCVTFLGGHLLLPVGVGIDLPLLPALNKFSITAIVALLLTAVTVSQTPRAHTVLPGWLPRHPIALLLIALFVIGIFGTVATNGDPQVYGPRVIPGVQPYDIISDFVRAAILMLPLLLARKVLASPEGQRVLLWSLTVSALFYTIPSLWEVRMSPQLHNQIYGFFPHSFAQHVRAGGFRPAVFTGHGLALAMYFTVAVIAAAGLTRVSDGEERIRWLLAGGWLFFVLVMCKSFGPLVLVLVFAPLVLLLAPRVLLMITASIGGIVILYPALRAAGLVPIDSILSFVDGIDPARAKSFWVRVYNEDMLLAKAQERPLFGWGSWGRSRVFDGAGRDVSVVDGGWIGQLGSTGWVGYIAIFGLLSLPLFVLLLRPVRYLDPVCLALVAILTATLIDLIPNAGSPVIYLLVAGALIGRLERDSVVLAGAEATGREAAVAKPGRFRDAAVPYTRRFPRKGEQEQETSDPGPATSRPRPGYHRSKLKPGYHR